jgi:hypothetical protein
VLIRRDRAGVQAGFELGAAERIDPAGVVDGDLILLFQAAEHMVEDGGREAIGGTSLELSSGQAAVAGEEAEQEAFAAEVVSVGLHLGELRDRGMESGTTGVPGNGSGSGVDGSVEDVEEVAEADEVPGDERGAPGAGAGRPAGGADAGGFCGREVDFAESIGWGEVDEDIDEAFVIGLAGIRFREEGRDRSGIAKYERHEVHDTPYVLSRSAARRSVSQRRIVPRASGRG